MTNSTTNRASRDRDWQIVQQLEDIKAILMDIRGNLDTIKKHTLYHDILNPEPSFDQIYDEATQGKARIRDAEDRIIELRALLAEGEQEEDSKPDLKIVRKGA